MATTGTTIRRYLLDCGHVVENTEVWPVGTKMTCGKVGQAGTHIRPVVKKLRNKLQASA